jgi:hypothetical protein
MKLKTNALRQLILEILNEIPISAVSNISCAAGSTHVMKTCKIGEDEYFLKFSDEDLFSDIDPSLQILVEYIAYKIYSLYPGIRIPKVELVWDEKNKRVGLASGAVKGKMVGNINVDPKKLSKMLTAGVFVDVFLANWDVIGTGSGNVVVDKEKDTAIRIDPGGSLTFRAQGGKKGGAFNKDAGELQSMLEPGMGAGDVYQYADLREAGKIFLFVSWEEISSTLVQTNNEVIVPELKNYKLGGLLKQWKPELLQIHNILKERHKEIIKHINFILKGE